MELDASRPSGGSASQASAGRPRRCARGPKRGDAIAWLRPGRRRSALDRQVRFRAHARLVAPAQQRQRRGGTWQVSTGFGEVEPVGTSRPRSPCHRRQPALASAPLFAPGAARAVADSSASSAKRSIRIWRAPSSAAFTSATPLFGATVPVPGLRRRLRRIGERGFGQRPMPGLAGDLRLGAALRLCTAGTGLRAGALGCRRSRCRPAASWPALLADAGEHGGAGLPARAGSRGVPRACAAGCRRAAGDFLAVAGDERHGRALVEQARQPPPARHLPVRWRWSGRGSWRAANRRGSGAMAPEPALKRCGGVRKKRTAARLRTAAVPRRPDRPRRHRGSVRAMKLTPAKRSVTSRWPSLRLTVFSGCTPAPCSRSRYPQWLPSHGCSR